ncbi:MAG: DMT family transporter, partial [Bacteroidota bacterium]
MGSLLKNRVIPFYVYALPAMIFWGMSFVWTRLLLQYYQPVAIILIRLLISSLFLFILIALFRVKATINRKDIPLLLLSALFNPFLYFIGENYGLKYTTSTVTSVIIATIPLFTPIAAWVFFKEKLSWLNIGGLGVSFAGIILMLMKSESEGPVSLQGIPFLAGAVCAAIFYSVTLRKLADHYNPLVLIAWQNLAGVFLFLPLFLLFSFQDTVKVIPDAQIIKSFIFLSILASSLSYVFFAKTIKLVGISKANIFTNLIPVFTAIFSFFILAEEFSLMKIIGILVVIAGVSLSE